MSIGFGIIVALHGLIHLMGFVKAFRLAEISQLTLDISRPVGLLWLAAAIIFLAAATVLFVGRGWWWLLAAAATVLSQVLIVMFWKDAKFGTIANVIVLVGVILGYGYWSFDLQVQENRRTLLKMASLETGETITPEALADLPQVVQTWIGKSGLVGGKPARVVSLEQQGKMRTKPDGKWMPFTAVQWFTVRDPGFIWRADVEAGFGVRLAGLDTYRKGRGYMLIKLLSLIPVVDVRGDEIDQGALVRYLAEIIWFPSAALEDYLQWEQVDAATARATMTCGGISASGAFHFSTDGDVVKFSAKRYYTRKDQATLEDWIIAIDPDSYKSFAGVRIPTRSTVTWKLREGDFTWFKLEITSIQHSRW